MMGPILENNAERIDMAQLNVKLTALVKAAG